MARPEHLSRLDRVRDNECQESERAGQKTAPEEAGEVGEAEGKTRMHGRSSSSGTDE